jgi:hypothetical protein
MDGYVTDAETESPLEGIVVSAEGIVDTTSADGYYKLVNLPIYTDAVRLRDEHLTTSRGDYYDMEMPASGLSWHFTQDFAMMPYHDLVSVLAGSYDENFYKFFRALTQTEGILGRPTIFRNWDHYPVTVYNPPFTWKDVDIQAFATWAIDTWNDMTGKELFIVTDDEEAADVRIVYDTEVDRKHHVEWLSYKEDGSPEKMIISIHPLQELSPIWIRGRRIFAHELGHILQLGHSVDLGHLMVGNTAPITDIPSTDEINLVRSLVGVPHIIDTSWYKDD